MNVTLTGSATNGTDYATISSPVTIPALQNSVSVPIITINDGAQEGYETAMLTLTTSAAYTLTSSITASVTIQDDDINNPPVITVTSPTIRNIALTNITRRLMEGRMAHHKPLHALRALLLLLALLPATLQAQDARTANVALINEKLAHHVGVLAYLFGILIDGRPCVGARCGPDGPRLSYLFQGNALFDSLTALENVALPLVETTRIRPRAANRQALKLFEQLDLGDIAGKYPSQISGGMQKRVALARALITRPQLLLFDEPTAGLDPQRKNGVFTMVAEYGKRFDFTALMLSHDIP